MDKVILTRNTIRLKEIDMFYFDTKADGPTIVCLHGRWGRAQTWYDFMLRYGAKYRVIPPSPRSKRAWLEWQTRINLHGGGNGRRYRRAHR